MVYFLGRDLTVAITTESIYAGLVSTDGIAKLRDTTSSANAGGITNWTGSNGTLFAGARVAESDSVFGDVAQGLEPHRRRPVIRSYGRGPFIRRPKSYYAGRGEEGKFYHPNKKKD